MITIYDNAHTLPSQWHTRLHALSTTTISDALASQDILYGGTLPGDLKEIHGHHFFAKSCSPELPCTASPQRTFPVVGLITTVYAPQGTSLPLHLAIYTHAAHRFIIVATDGWINSSYIGDIQATTAKRNGCLGLCIDGYIRDSRGLNDLSLPIYARGARPNAPTKQEVGGINVPISIGGLTIHNGDIAVADEDGLVVIPYRLAEKTIHLAEQKEEADRKRLSAVMDFDFSAADNAGDYVPIMNATVREYVKKEL